MPKINIKRLDRGMEKENSIIKYLLIYYITAWNSNDWRRKTSTPMHYVHICIGIN